MHTGPALDAARATARALGMEIQAVEVRQRGDLPRAFATLTARRAGAVLALSDPVVGNELAQISKLAAQALGCPPCIPGGSSRTRAVS